MYNIQANTARFIYTLSLNKPYCVKTQSDDDNARYRSYTSKLLPLLSPAQPPSNISSETTCLPSNGATVKTNRVTANFKSSLKNEKSRYNHNARRIVIENSCQLRHSGFYITKEARSDEKLRYTETDIRTLVRTVIFMYVFDIQICDSLTDIVNSGAINIAIKDSKIITNLTLEIMTQLIDLLFGDNFSTIAKIAIAATFEEYQIHWKYFPYGASAITLPTAGDIIKLARFVNVTTPYYSPATLFITNNSNDHKIPLQSNIKRL